MLLVQGNLASTYKLLGRLEIALRVRQDVYSRHLKLHGEESERTLRAANNYATSLLKLQRFDEAKALLRKTIPGARRALGESHLDTLRMRMNYAQTLYKDEGAALDDLREALTTLEETGRISHRVLGGTHPMTTGIEDDLRTARAVLQIRARET